MLPHESPILILFSSRVKRDLLEAYPGFDQEEKRKLLQMTIFTNGLPRKIKQKKLLGPLPADYDQLLKEAERIHDLPQDDETYRQNDMLMAKVDKILDNMRTSGLVIKVRRTNRFRTPGNVSYSRNSFHLSRNQRTYSFTIFSQKKSV